MNEPLSHLSDDSDVEEILRIAIRGSGSDTASLRERLSQVAGEMGITEEQLAAAEAQWKVEKQRTLFERQYRAAKRRGILERVVSLGTAAMICLVVDFATNHTFTWSAMVVPILGAVLLTRFLKTLASTPTEEDFVRWRETGIVRPRMHRHR